MRLPLDFLPMALCGLATIVAVAAIVVVSDVLRRFVLFLIAHVERSRGRTRRGVVVAARPAEPKSPQGSASAPGTAAPVSRSETLPG